MVGSTYEIGDPPSQVRWRRRRSRRPSCR